jgi:aspartate beta-hydroxylase
MDKEVDMLYLDETDTQKLGALLSEARKKYSRAALERVEETFAMAVGAKPLIGPEDPSQEGTDFYFAGLPKPKPWHDEKEFPTCVKLEQSWEAIRDELMYALDNRRGFQHYVRRYDDKQNDPNSEVPKEWKALYLKDHLQEFPENRAMCPETIRIIDDEPRVENYVFFSALDPGGHIAPHHSTYNWIFVMHLGLIVPENADCVMRVGNAEPKRWKEGKSHVFDASFEHEAWNRGDTTRFILLIDTFHPDLTEIELTLLKQANTYLSKAMERSKANMAHNVALKEGKRQLEDKKWWV